MNYNRKIMRLELSAEKALNGGYYYAELLLPATDYEIKDAMTYGTSQKKPHTGCTAKVNRNGCRCRKTRNSNL